MNKFDFLIRSLKNYFIPKVCPFCGGKNFIFIERKYLVTSLEKCSSCNLKSRFPLDDPKFLEKFYQSDYKVDVQMMTYLPSDNEIVELKSRNFDNLISHKNLIEIFARKHSDKIIDYGCSWGYNVFKLKNDGFEIKGFELSIPRAKFGMEKLGVEIFFEEDKIPQGNKIFFSSHVIEHLSSISNFVNLAKYSLEKNGVFIALCPNGSEEFRKRKPKLYKGIWGSLHPSYIDIDFVSYLFKENPYYITTGDDVYDLEKLSKWDGLTQVIDNVKDGFELLVVAKPNIKI